MSRRSEIALAMGCEVEQLEPVRVAGELLERWCVRCPSNEEAVRVFNAWAKYESAEGEMRDLGQRFRAHALASGFEPTEFLARVIQEYVQEHVRFQSEPGEVSRSSATTLRLGAGDCDDSAVLVVALDLAAGLQARVVGVRRDDGEIVHAAAVVRVHGRDYWQEASLAARFDEHPFDAAARIPLVSRDELTP